MTILVSLTQLGIMFWSIVLLVAVELITQKSTQMHFFSLKTEGSKCWSIQRLVVLILPSKQWDGFLDRWVVWISCMYTKIPTYCRFLFLSEMRRYLNQTRGWCLFWRKQLYSPLLQIIPIDILNWSFVIWNVLEGSTFQVSTKSLICDGSDKVIEENHLVISTKCITLKSLTLSWSMPPCNWRHRCRVDSFWILYSNSLVPSSICFPP